MRHLQIKNNGISTHALTWSATLRLYINVSFFAISTHALTWSATDEMLKIKNKQEHFNSRAHVERDWCFEFYYY